MIWFDVAAENSFREYPQQRVRAANLDIVVVYHDEQFYALQDRCSHGRYPLCDSPLEGDAIICTRHGARFRLRDGVPLCGPAQRAVPCYPVRVEAGIVQVGIAE